MKNKSEAFFERAKKVSPGGVHSPVRSFSSVGGTPIFFEKSEGPYLWDVDGKKYIDFCQSFGPLLFGHRNPEIAEVVHQTVDTAWSFGACEPYSLELSENIVQNIPWIEKIRFVNSGTEAVMSALRVARAATRRSKILKFDGCYHGHLDSLLVKAGSGLAGIAGASSSDSAGIHPETIVNTRVLPLDDEAALISFFEKEGTDLALVAIEPLPANYGLLIQRREFLAKLVELAKKFGALVLFDEVISGFRVGLRGMAGDLNLEPDLVCYGKIIGGGFPVGAYAGKARYMDLVAPQGPVYQAGTLSANPIGMRAGLAQMKKIQRENPYPVLEKNLDSFSCDFQNLLNRYAKTLTISQNGHQVRTESEWKISKYASLFWIHSETETPIRRIDQIPEFHKERFAAVFHALLEDGIYLAPSGYEVGFLSTSHSDSILSETLEKAEQALKKIYTKEGGKA
jgi:glutamate-1-semialdehyde 2,1-aminomutase